MKLKLITIASLLLLTIITSTGNVAAADPDFTIDSFTADYYLDKDKNGVGVLSAQEVILADFPLSGTGISQLTRSIPEKYQKHGTNLKITSVTDSAGNPRKYSTSQGSDNSLIITMGDPAINLYGKQSYVIKYESRNVINFAADHLEFYPNFNGRGWNQTFNSATGVIHVAKSLAGELASEPQCFTEGSGCTVSKQQMDSETVYTVKNDKQLAAHQSLSAKFSFKQGTFKEEKTNRLTSIASIFGVLLTVLVILALIRTLFAKIKTKKTHKSRG